MEPNKSPFYADKHAIASAVSGGDDSLYESYSEDSGQFTPHSQGSQELHARDPASFDGQTRSAGKVLDKSRRCKPVVGAVKVETDDTEHIDPDFAHRIRSSVICLKFECYNVVVQRTVPYLGQAAFVRNPENDEVKLATCKHNIGSALNKEGQFEECFPPHTCMLHDQSNAKLNIPNTGWEKKTWHALTLRDGATWSNGFDLALGPVINENTAAENWPVENVVQRRMLHDLLPKVRHFEVVDDTFSYDVGLKIGIVAYNAGGRIKEDVFSEVNGLAGIDIGSEETYAADARGVKRKKIEAVLGQKDSVMIYTGQITFAGEEYIEYDVNTYEGCSGSIGIVMDRGHPAFGKALAVHAGFCEGLHKNIGFKLAGAFDRQEDQPE